MQFAFVSPYRKACLLQAGETAEGFFCVFRAKLQIFLKLHTFKSVLTFANPYFNFNILAGLLRLYLFALTLKHFCSQYFIQTPGFYYTVINCLIIL